MLKRDEVSFDEFYDISMTDREPQTIDLQPCVTYTEVEHPLHGLFAYFFYETALLRPDDRIQLHRSIDNTQQQLRGVLESRAVK